MIEWVGRRYPFNSMKTKSIISTEILHLAAERCQPWRT